MRAARSRRLLTLCVLALTVGCADYSQLSFRTDKRLTFVSPGDRERVRLPLQLEWTIRDFDLVQPGTGEPRRNAGYFAVFVDRAPVRAGQSLAAVAEKDRVCMRRPGCPDTRYLADRQIYTTTEPRLTLERVRAVPGRPESADHFVQVVLLDSAGRRIGESAWRRYFVLVKDGDS